MKKVHRVIRFSQRRRNYLASETNYRTTILLAIEIKKKKKTEILMNKPACLGLSILELSKILMCEFWYD